MCSDIVDNLNSTRVLVNDGVMTQENVTLNPVFPLCWENMETLRIGFDRAEVRLHTPSPAAQRFVDQLRAGIHPRDLESVAKRSGLPSDERELLMHQLKPVLLQACDNTSEPLEEDHQAALFAVFGEGSFARRVRRRFELAGLALATEAASPDFVVLVEQFVGTTTRAQSLLSNDVPHLLLRATDRHLVLGPLVLPGGRPCLTCLELHSLEKEPSLHVLAAQLANEIPAAATTHGIELLSESAIAVARQWQHGCTDFVGVRLIFSVVCGVPVPLPEREDLSPHPDCGCVSLSPLV